MTQMPYDPPPPPPQAPRRGMDAFFDSIRGVGIRRSTERWIGGVAGGVARRLDVDPLVVRGVLAASVLLGGLGLVLYGIAWLLLPEESDGRIHAQQMLRGDVDVAVLGAGAAILAGLSVPEMWLPWFAQGFAGWWRGLTWLALLGLVVVVIVTASRGRRNAPRWQPPPPAWQQTPPGPAGWQQTPWSAGAPAAHPTGEPMSTTSEPFAGDRGAVTENVPADPGPADELPAQEAEPTAPTTPGTPPPPAWSSQGWSAQSSGAPAPAGPGWPGGPGTPGGPGWGTPGPQPSGGGWPVTRTRERGPGGAVLGVVGAVTLLTLAGLLYAERIGAFDGPVALTTLTVGLVLLGVAIVISGVRGRRAGGVTALAIVGLLVAVPLAGTARWDGDLHWVGDVQVGQVTHTPTTVSAAEGGFRLGAGQATVDLTQVPLSSTTTVDVPIRMGAGNLVVILPAHAAVTAHVEMGAGNVTWVDGSSRSGAGGNTHELETSAAAAGRHVELALDVRTGLGDVTFEEENR
ncbi:PspC domain-containing protein [Isoptericola sp. b490]|uniref:PspC domain-containing protein n=1 Tax=Actinotalea lenta TaxID=3064654 RepID=UPI002713A8D3|nr:PspC domain-containing protein [Isoptericola sp. b490]MDO8122336.1 PspC domain-containing protein [Isoptericola sp. b490]